MTVVTKRYKPPHTSEREFAVRNLCRLVVLTAARGVETTGEVFVRAQGTPYTHTQRMSIANKLRRYAAEARGEPPMQAKGFNRDQALYAYKQAFPTGRAIAVDPTPDEMWEMLRDGWFLSVSGNTDDVRNASQLDDWVNDVAHEIGLLPWPTSKDAVKVIEPMRPKGSGLATVTWADVKRFTSEFATDGRRLCIKVRAGYDTKAARARRRSAGEIDDLKDVIERVRDKRDLFSQQVTELTGELDEAKAELTALQDQVDAFQAGTENAKAAGWEAFGNAIGTEVTRLLNEGPA